MSTFDSEYIKSFGGVTDEVFVGRLAALLEARKDMLRAASDLGHAALDGVADELEREFPEELKNRRHRQLVGAMIRRHMEWLGYRLEKAAVRVRRGKLFSVAARYERKPAAAPPVSAADYIAEVNARLDWMERNGRSTEERAQVIELERQWLAHRHDDAVADAWYRTLVAGAKP